MGKSNERSAKLLQILIKKNLIYEACRAINDLEYRNYLYKLFNI